MTLPGALLLPSPLLFPSAPTDIIPSGRDMPFITLGGFLFENRQGVRFSRQVFTGWTGTTGTSLAVDQKTRGPGGWRSNTPQRTPRIIVLEETIQTDTTARMQEIVDTVNVLSSLDEILLQVDQHGVTRMALVSIQDTPAWTEYQSKTRKRFSLQLVATDPRKFGPGVQTSTLLPSASGGLTIPFTVPFTIDSTVIPGTCSLTNPAAAGQPAGKVYGRVDGPVDTPTITHSSDLGTTVWQSPAVLGAGQWLDIDFDGHSARANGTALRAVSKRAWPGFDPGGNTWAFTAAAPNPAARLSITAFPAWA